MEGAVTLCVRLSTASGTGANKWDGEQPLVEAWDEPVESCR